MRKLQILILLALALMVIGIVYADQMIFSTYYPAPYGRYRQFSTTGLTLLATDEFGNEGATAKVGIGTTDPDSLLHIAGGDGESGLHIRTGETDGVDYLLHLEDQDGSVQGLYVDVNGQVGVGTTNPTGGIFVIGDDDIGAGDTPFRISAEEAQGHFFINYLTDFNPVLRGESHLDIVADATLELKAGTGPSHAMIFHMRGTEAMRIDSVRNVGVGTNDPKTKLDVNGLIRTARYSDAAKPTASVDNKGAIFYNTDDDKMYYSDGSDWQTMGGGGGWSSSGAQVFGNPNQNAPTSWTDMNLSSYVGSNEALVYLKIWTSSRAGFSFRTNGETKDVGLEQTGYFNQASGATKVELDNDHVGYVAVVTDPFGMVEWECGSSGRNTDVWLLGYVN